MYADEAFVCVCAQACGRNVGICVRVHVDEALVSIAVLTWKMALHKLYHNLSERYNVVGERASTYWRCTILDNTMEHEYKAQLVQSGKRASNRSSGEAGMHAHQSTRSC